MNKICLIVVTFNRLNLLKKLVTQISYLAYKPNHLLIVDNGSNDGTREYLNVLKSLKFDFKFDYVVQKNQGSAGGFNTGLLNALKWDVDYFWLMDDDGYPSRDCLKSLLPYLNQETVLASVCLNPDDSQMLSFPLYNEKYNFLTYNDLKNHYQDQVENYASFYNSIIIPKNIINQIGMPKKEMFLWGDEVEYYFRIKKNKFKIYTVINSIHYHPKNKQNFLCKKNFYILNEPIEWKFFCFYRNYYYINRINGAKYFGIYMLIKDLFSLFFIFNNLNKYKYSMLLIKAFYEGSFNKFRTIVPF